MGHFRKSLKELRATCSPCSHCPQVQRPQWFSYQLVSNERRGRVPAGPRPLCLAPVTVRYISTLQLPTSYPGSFLYAPGWRKYPGWGWSHDPYKIDSLSGGWESLWSHITCFHFRTSHFDCKEWPPEESSF
jgi:hypothetical protein